MVKELKYLTKFPISIFEKKHSKLSKITGKYTHYKSRNSYAFSSKYGYFKIDKNGSVNFIITLKDSKNKVSYTIKIAKQYLYDSLMLNLLSTPIIRRKERNSKFWVNKKIQKHIPSINMNDMTPSEIMDSYINVKKELESIVKTTNDSKRKRTAEIQLENLLEQNWKAELLFEISMSEKIINTEI